MERVKIEQFEGPLDLLLQLIEKQELDVTKLALANVTEQFLSYVRQLEEVDPTQLADFLSVAARLLVIKSKAILPGLEVEAEEEDTAKDLTEQLLIFKQFREVAKAMKALDERQLQSFTRTTTFEQRVYFFPDPSVTPDTLRSAAGRLMTSLKELDNLPKARIREAISIQHKIEHLRNHITSRATSKLSELMGSAKSKHEAIVTFLALLELIKMRVLSVEQESLFDDITINVIETSPIPVVE